MSERWTIFDDISWSAFCVLWLTVANEILQGATPTKTLREVCYAHILATLDQCGGNKSHAARALDIDRRALYRWLDKIRLNERWESGEA